MPRSTAMSMARAIGWRRPSGEAAPTAPGPRAALAPGSVVLPPILVLGMHRSGTSFLGGSLQAANLALDVASTGGKHNRRGKGARRDLREFHEAMLARRGLSWKAPPGGPVGWALAEREAALGQCQRNGLEQGRGQAHPCWMTPRSPIRHFKSSPEVIRLAVMHYVRVLLSPRSVEGLLHERGIEVSDGTVRFWWLRLGPMSAVEIRRGRVSGRRASRWRRHLDEVFVRVNGVQRDHWRAVGHEGEVLAAYVSKRRDRAAALTVER